MLKLTIHYSIFKLRKDWNQLYHKNPNLSVFQDFNYAKNIFLTIPYRGKRVATFMKFTDTRTNEVIMIAPLTQLILSRERNKWGIFGDIQGCDICDFIYSENLSIEIMKECIVMMREYCKGDIMFRRINERSLMLKAVLQLYPKIVLAPYPYVRIHASSTLDDYIGSLSKSTRQNIRTAYNRLLKDGLEYRLENLIPICENNGSLWLDSLHCYVNRQIQQFGNLKFKSKILTYLYYKFWKHDSISLKRMDNGCLFSLKINGEIAAMMTGFINKTNGSIVIPRLAINQKYRNYSPGSLLVVEVMKYLLEETTLHTIDLSRGNETYKYNLGGVEYHTYSFSVPKNSQL